MTPNLMIGVRSPDDLEHLGDWLHDAVFEAGSVIWAQDEREVVMRFWREGDEIPSRTLFRLLPFVRTRRFRRIECVARWRGVRQLVARERDRLDYHCVTELRSSMVDGVQKIEFVTEGAMDLYMFVDKLDGECRDTGKETEYQFGFRTLAFSGVGQVVPTALPGGSPASTVALPDQRNPKKG